MKATKHEMIVDGLMRNIRTTLFNKRNAGINTSVFYVEPEYQGQITGKLELEGYKVIPIALYELKVKWEIKKDDIK